MALISSRAWGFIRAGTFGRFGPTTAQLGTGGTQPNLVADDVLAGDAAAGVEFCPVVSSQMAAGDLRVLPDGGTSFVDAPDGTYSQTYPLWIYVPGDAATSERMDGGGQQTLTINVGDASTTVAPTTAEIALSGHAPTVTQSVALVPASADITLTGHAPTVAQPVTVAPGTGDIALIGHAPSVSQVVQLVPATAEVQLTGHEPTVAQPVSVAPGTADVALTGHAPDVSQALLIQPSPAQLVLLGFAPTVSQPLALTPGAAQIVLAGWAPTLGTPAPSLVISRSRGVDVVINLPGVDVQLGLGVDCYPA